MRVCLVKQHTTYDLYTRCGPNLREMVASSNWRSGPLGLWEAFDTDFKVVWENSDPECQLGKRHWRKYVEGWDVWPGGGKADNADTTDWGAYDVVISIDIAVPTRVVRRFPGVMWCYFFIEGGPTAIDGMFRGSPFYGYNVFLNHRLAKQTLSPDGLPIRSMHHQRRAVLDFPYYLQSAKSIQSLYPPPGPKTRNGMVFSHHSYPCLTSEDLCAFAALGTVRRPQQSISDIHRCELLSKYFIVHPACKPMAGVGVIEAISAGCLALAPVSKLWGFPEILSPSLDYQNVEELVDLLRKLDANPVWYDTERSLQAAKVQDWCFRLPTANLELLHRVFQQSKCSRTRQIISEKLDYAKAKLYLGGLRLFHLAKRLASLWKPTSS